MTDGPPSLIGITIRRSIASGRLFLIVTLIPASIVSFALSRSGGTAFVSAFPIVLPVLGGVGALGGLVVFSNDRVKGVLEYLLAYGVSSRRLFANVLIATMVLETILLGGALAIGLGLYLATRHTISGTLALALGLYSVPMSYTSSAFVTTVGMFWTSLSSPREAMNSPIGFAPIFGIAPSAITLAAVAFVSAAGISYEYLVVFAAPVVLAAIVLLLLSLTRRLLRNERLLSPA